LQIQKQTLVNTGETNTDGSFWGATIVAAPSGVQPIVTPTATEVYSNNEYVFTNQAFPLTLQILDANNNDANLSTQTNTVIVGQQMNLVCQLSVTNSFMTNWPMSQFQWTVPGFAISNYVVAADNSSAMVITNFPLNNTNVVFYWIDGATNRTLQCSVTVNGQTVSGQATFDIIRPTVDWIGQMTGATAVDTNYVRFRADLPPNLTWLHLGNSLDTNDNVTQGIVFTATNLNLNGYSGEYNSLFCVQLITSNLVTEHCYTNGNSVHRMGFGLDGHCPYASLNGALMDTSDSTHDAPTTTCPSTCFQAAYNGNFQMYAMFQAQSVPSIPVPLKVITWSWDASAATSTNSQWSVISSNAIITLNNQETLIYPQWSGNVTNYTSITNNTCD
jgi:hypothetical protein